MKRWRWMSALLICAAAQAATFPPPIRALIANGVTIKGTMQAPAGFIGYVGEYDGDPIPIYLLPDGKHVLIGTLYDANGKDLTQAAFAAATSPGMDPALWAKLEKSTWIAEGAAKPRRVVYVFTDTECPYCHKLWLASQPYLMRGQLQIRNIIVAVIGPESLPRGAAIVASGDPVAVWRKHELAFGHSPIKPLDTVPVALRARIDANTALLKSIDSFGTPAIVYRDHQGKIRMVIGSPNEDTLREILGSR